MNRLSRSLLIGACLLTLGLNIGFAPETDLKKLGSAYSGLKAERVAERLSETETPDQAAILARYLLQLDPRSEQARLVLAQAAYERGDYESLLTVYTPLFDTDPSQRPAYAQILAELSRIEAMRDVVYDYLEYNRPIKPFDHLFGKPPNWTGLYLRELAKQDSLSDADLLPFFELYPKHQSYLISRILKRQDWLGAYITFASLLDGPQSHGMPGLSIPYNPEFLELEKPRPFNWSLSSRNSEWLENGGMYAYFQGRRKERFVQQSFPLNPGRYVLKAFASGEVSKTGGWFRWNLACTPSNQLLAGQDIQDLKVAVTQTDMSFQVP